MRYRRHSWVDEQTDKIFAILWKRCEKCGSEFAFRTMYRFTYYVYGHGRACIYGCRECFKEKKDFVDYIKYDGK